jgi:enterochelin esterase-like enzyme
VSNVLPVLLTTKQNKLHGLSPQANYTDRVTATCRRSWWFLQHCGTNDNFPAFMIFTDQAWFTRDGIQQFHNQLLWEDENPHAVLHHHLGQYLW